MKETRYAPPTLPKWPFLLGDLGLIAMSFWIMVFGDKPLSISGALVCGIGIAGGALLFIAPFYLEYRAALRREENQFLSDAVRKVGKLTDVGEIVVNALEQWQYVQQHSDKILKSSTGLVDRMGAETSEFMEFLKKADDTRQKTLELQVEKLQQVEGDWLKTTTMILDHVFALYQAGLRFGQKALVTQLSQFMEACLDAVRRMGLVAFEPENGCDFDGDRHQVVGMSEIVDSGSIVKEVVAFGYFFHGRLHRKALVYIEKPQSTSPPSSVKTPRIKLRKTPQKIVPTEAGNTEAQPKPDLPSVEEAIDPPPDNVVSESEADREDSPPQANPGIDQKQLPL
ncbi:MAG TPA: hypothetical protein EYQ50_09245 [Verrucomicrobiales bacterium]|nr:hypothetical protein [Verrucomicrobiales bacterium]